RRLSACENEWQARDCRGCLLPNHSTAFLLLRLVHFLLKHRISSRYGYATHQQVNAIPPSQASIAARWLPCLSLNWSGLNASRLKCLMLKFGPRASLIPGSPGRLPYRITLQWGLMSDTISFGCSSSAQPEVPKPNQVPASAAVH